MAALTGTALGIAIAGGLSAAGMVASTLLAPKPKMPAQQQQTPTMPDADDQKVQMAKKRSIIGQMQRSGRSSTILTGDDDKLGG